MDSELHCEKIGKTGNITLNRPKSLNALTLDMVLAMHQALLEWSQDEHISAVIIQPSEKKAYCAGGDIRWLYESGKHNKAQQLQFFRDEYHLNYLIAQYQKPIIPIISGITMGGGIGISLHASHPIASSCTVFSMPETAIGFFPDIGASHLLSNCPGMTGLYLALTGARFNAQDAKYLGLIREVIDPKDIDVVTKNLHQINNSQDIESIIDDFAMAQPVASTLQESVERIDSYFSHDRLDSIIDALKISSDPWAQTTLKQLLSKSPLSLSVTFAMMQKAKSKTLLECLEVDYCLAENFMKSDDFYEGVRAMVVDKDKNPQWKPASLDDITATMLRNFFESPLSHSVDSMA